MAEETTRRNPAAKKTTKKSSGSVNTNIPTTSEQVSTATPADGTARNAVIEGNGSLDLDAVRRRAYELYEQRGSEGRHGASPEEDWYRAETELLGRNKNTSGGAQSSPGKNTPGANDRSAGERVTERSGEQRSGEGNGGSGGGRNDKVKKSA